MKPAPSEGLIKEAEETMKVENIDGAAISIILAFHGALKRGNLDISSDDPVSCALWIGASSLLKDFVEATHIDLIDDRKPTDKEITYGKSLEIAEVPGDETIKALEKWVESQPMQYQMCLYHSAFHEVLRDLIEDDTRFQQRRIQYLLEAAQENKLIDSIITNLANSDPELFKSLDPVEATGSETATKIAAFEEALLAVESCRMKNHDELLHRSITSYRGHAIFATAIDSAEGAIANLILREKGELPYQKLSPPSETKGTK